MLLYPDRVIVEMPVQINVNNKQVTTLVPMTGEDSTLHSIHR